MRRLIMAAGAALALSACGGGDQAANNVNVDGDLTADKIVTNDVTAIDAVTADAANMAADVDINFTNEQLGDDDSPSTNRSAARPGNRPASRGGSEPRAAPEPAPATPAQNATGNSV